MNYQTLVEIFNPPHAMTAAEYAEWFQAERQPVIDAYGLTIEEAGGALLAAFNEPR